MEEKNITEIILPYGTGSDYVVMADVQPDEVQSMIEALEGELSESPNPGGRPTKLTADFISAAEIVLSQDINAIIYTDEELLMLINERLEESARIDYATFKRWKAKNKDGQTDILDVIGIRFCALIKSALAKQKSSLFDRLRTSDEHWQRWAWIIERKFNEWNIRVHHELTGKDGGPVKTVGASVTVPASADAVKNYTTQELETLLEKMPE